MQPQSPVSSQPNGASNSQGDGFVVGEFSPTPTGPNAQQPTPPKQPKRFPLGKVLLLLLALVMLATDAAFVLRYLLGDDAHSGSVAATKQDEVASSSSIFNYIHDASKIKTARVIVEGGSTESTQVVPSMTGTLGRDPQTNQLGMDLDLDETLVAAKIKEVEQLPGYKQTTLRNDFSDNHNYQIDLGGLLASLGVLTRLDSDSVEFQLGEKAKAASCTSAIEAFNQKSDAQLAAIRTDYKRQSNGEYVWTLNAPAIAMSLDAEKQAVNQGCGQIFDQNSGGDESKLRLWLKTVSAGNATILSVHYDPGIYTSPIEDVIFAAQLTDINKSTAAKGGTFTGPTLFQTMRTAHYVLAINRCKALPITASNFMAGYNYTLPTDESYYGPTLFDSGHYCTAQEAEAAGYRP